MKITKVDIPAAISNNGIEDIKMDRLGQVVILAGKNGSGKTRILSQVAMRFNSKLTEKVMEKLNFQIINTQQEIRRTKGRLSQLGLTEEQKKIHHEELHNYETNIKQLTAAQITYVITDKVAGQYESVVFVPKNMSLSDPYHLQISQVAAYASEASNNGMNNLSNNTLPYIQNKQNIWYETSNPSSTASREEKKHSQLSYKSLDDLIYLFLGTRLDRNKEGQATLFDLQIGQSQLSDGQKSLIQYCVALHAQGATLDNSILFMDEPENSMHPAAIIQAIERIKQLVPNGQIWIATHSLPILAHFDPSSIWYVESGKVTHAGKIPEKVLESLLGDEEERSKLSDFINLPAQLALTRHAFESLLEPQVVETDSKDPQTLQIRKELVEFMQEKGKIKVLDFGSGKGRLLANIIESSNGPVEELVEWFDYVAYDDYDDNKDVCLSVLSSIYNDSEKRYFNKTDKIYEVHDKNSFDVVVMCNVLHEIDPKAWLELFSEHGIIPTLLSENGILLLVEDHLMPIGEKAYQKGYIVLDTAELKDLFNIKGELKYHDVRGDGRLKAHRIKRNELINISAETRLKALASIHEKAKREIIDIRTKEQTYQKGKEHGFWLQQYANTGLALNEL